MCSLISDIKSPFMSNMSDQPDLRKRSTLPSKIIQTDLAQGDLVVKLNPWNMTAYLLQNTFYRVSSRVRFNTIIYDSDRNVYRVSSHEFSHFRLILTSYELVAPHTHVKLILRQN